MSYVPIFQVLKLFQVVYFNDISMAFRCLVLAPDTASFSLILAEKPFVFFPDFPDWKKVFKIFPDQWEPWVLLKSHLLKKPFAHVLPKVSQTLLPPSKALNTIPYLYADSLYRKESRSQLVLHCDRRQQLLLLLGRPRLDFVQYRMRLQQK